MTAKASAYFPCSQQQFAVLEFVYKHDYPVQLDVLTYLPRSQQQFAVLEYVYKHDKLKGLTYLPRSQHQFAVLEFVTQHELKVEDVDLEEDEDADWNITEPAQTTDDSDDDEWLRVGELYSPSVLEDMCLLTANPESVGVGGAVAHKASTISAALDLSVPQTKKEKVKLLYRKRNHCQVGAMSSGRLCQFKVKKARRTKPMKASNSPSRVMSIDIIGVVRDVVEAAIDQIDFNNVLIIDPNGMVRSSLARL